MNAEILKRHFKRMGAELVVGGMAPRRSRVFDLNVLKNKKLGEHYSLLISLQARDHRFSVLNVDADARHLLLFAKDPADHAGSERFLCGHDERHWFVATVPQPVVTIAEARRALLPPQLREAGLTTKHLERRHNEVFKRQGEWFFLPVEGIFAGLPILRGERLLRDRESKPHVVDEMVRFGGQAVVLCGGEEYSMAAWEARPHLHNMRHTRQTKNAEVFVRGSIKHPDHATLNLKTWHRVLLNGEILSRNQGFYD